MVCGYHSVFQDSDRKVGCIIAGSMAAKPIGNCKQVCIGKREGQNCILIPLPEAGLGDPVESGGRKAQISRLLSESTCYFLSPVRGMRSHIVHI